MASDDLARLRAMVEAMPDGPHRVEAFAYVGDVPEEIAAWVPTLATVPTSDGDMESQPTAEAVAALCNVAPELLAVAEAAEAVSASAEPDPMDEPMYAGKALDALNAALDALRAKVPR